MSDLVERLRENGPYSDSPRLIAEAADEIERLTAAAEVDSDPIVDLLIRGAIKKERERCAQVVNDYLIAWQQDFPPDHKVTCAYGASLLAKIVATIRALKDEP